MNRRWIPWIMGLNTARVYQDMVSDYHAFYIGSARLSDEEKCEATFVIVLAANSGWKDLVAQQLHKESPPCVWYALAKAKGIKAYYSITEEGGIDQIINLAELKDLLEASGILPPGARNNAY
ncbi:MAG: hypothetical protein R6X33_13005 [Candidatus Brocadiia bacterium]